MKQTLSLKHATIFGLSLANLWYQILIWLPAQWHRTDYDRDMTIYYYAAVNLHKGLPIYHLPSPAYGPDAAPQWYLYPPYLAAVLLPFVGHYLVFSRVWYVLQLACYWTYAYLLARLSQNRPTAAGILGWSLLLAATPSFWGETLSATYRMMSLGNVDPVIWVLFAGAILGRGRPLLLAAMTMLKPYAVFPWLVYVWQRGLRTALPSIVLVAAATLITVAIGGIEMYHQWVTRALSLAGQGTFDPINWSLSFAVLRILRDIGLWHYHGGPLPHGPRLYLTCAGLIGPIATAYLTRRHPLDLRAMPLFIASMLFAPLCWNTYLILAYVPFAWWLGHRRTTPTVANASKPALTETKA